MRSCTVGADTHACPAALSVVGGSPLKSRGYFSFTARRPHQGHLHRMALIPPNALPTLRPGRRGSLRGPPSPGVRPRTRGCPRGGDVLLSPRADCGGGGKLARGLSVAGVSRGWASALVTPFRTGSRGCPSTLVTTVKRRREGGLTVSHPTLYPHLLLVTVSVDAVRTLYPLL